MQVQLLLLEIPRGWGLGRVRAAFPDAAMQ